MPKYQEHRILVVDDEEPICKILKLFLEKEGYIVEYTTRASEVYTLARQFNPHILILDLMLQDGDGFDILKKIKTQIDAAIIILTGKCSTVDKVVGLEIGADDYVTKPFNRRELLARVRSVMRRHFSNDKQNGEELDKAVAKFNGWEFDMSNSELQSPDGEEVYLTSHEYQLLKVMVIHSDRIISRAQLQKLITGREWNPYDRSIDVTVAKLRKKFKDSSKQPNVIMTMRGKGYRFIAPVKFHKSAVNA